MSVYAYQDSLLTEINKTLTTLDDINSLSNKLRELDLEDSEDEIDEAKAILNQILDLCEEANQFLQGSQQYSEVIRLLLGNRLALLPIAKVLAFTASDASVVYHPDPEQRLSDLTQNPASNYYEKPPNRKVLGDLGELTVLKMLIDPDGEDNLSEQEIASIQIKPLLASRIRNNDQNPDFYLPSRRVVIDAKAWKKVGSRSLLDVIAKYADLECLSEGGEVRLYFPLDTCRKQQSLLEKLPQQIRNIRVRIVPMEKNYEDLISQREWTLIVKSLILPQQSDS